MEGKSDNGDVMIFPNFYACDLCLMRSLRNHKIENSYFKENAANAYESFCNEFFSPCL